MSLVSDRFQRCRVVLVVILLSWLPSVALGQTLWAMMTDRIREYRYDGTLLREFLVEGPSVGTPLAIVRNAAEDADGALWIYSGTGSATLSKLEPTTGRWTHYIAGQFGTVASITYGGLGIYGRYIFVTDSGSSSGRGVVRFDRETGTTVKFATDLSAANLTVGFNGLLYISTGNDQVHVHDPRSLDRLKTITLGTDWTLNVLSLSVMSDGEILTTSTGGGVTRWSPDGVQQARILLRTVTALALTEYTSPNNIVKLPDGRYAVSARFGEFSIVAEDLSSEMAFAVGSISTRVFVASSPTMVGPFVVADPPPVTLPVGVYVDRSLSASFESPTKKALSYSAQGLPAGLSLNAETGRLTGTPTEFGSFAVTLTATEPGVVPKAASLSLALTIGDAPATLVNIATRAYCSTGNNVTIGGFVIAGNVARQVLIRAIGPTLTTQGISSSEVLLDPVVEVYRNGSLIASNDNWGDATNAAEISRVGELIGAGAIASADTKSSALLLTLAPGVYSFIARGANSTSGIVILEVFDAAADLDGTRLVNIAARVRATTGDGVAIGGFVIGGVRAKMILIRAVGPTLSTQGLAGSEVLADPTIELYRGSQVIAANDDWSTGPTPTAIGVTGARIGATPLALADAKSSAILISLEPGVYSFIVRGKNETSGIVLVEIYDAD